MQPQRETGSVPDVTLERYRLGELPDDERAIVNARLAADAALQGRLEALAQSDEDIERLYDAASVARHVRARLDETQRTGGRVWVRRYMPAAALVGAAALILLVVPRSLTRPPVPDVVSTSGSDDGNRIKGLMPSLAVYRHTADGSERLADGDVAQPGDLLRLGYSAAGRRYGVIVSIDGAHGVTLHLPPKDNHAAPLAANPTLLDSAYELDTAPNLERFYFVTSDVPFAVDVVMDAARRAARADAAPPSRLQLSAAMTQVTFTIRKEAHR